VVLKTKKKRFNMGVYIIQPTAALSASHIEFMAKKLRASSREQQVNEMVALRKSDPVDREIRRWIKDARSYRAAPVAKRARYARITGTVILDMTDQEAEQLRRDLSEVVVLRDRPLELIQPRRAVAATKRKVTARDLWHLNMWCRILSHLARACIRRSWEAATKHGTELRWRRRSLPALRL
jgi:hypothetical protein